MGSSKTAAAINYSLAVATMEKGAPLARLVAETGGLNVLVAGAHTPPLFSLNLSRFRHNLDPKRSPIPPDIF